MVSRYHCGQVQQRPPQAGRTECKKLSPGPGIFWLMLFQFPSQPEQPSSSGAVDGCCLAPVSFCSSLSLSRNQGPALLSWTPFPVRYTNPLYFYSGQTICGVLGKAVTGHLRGTRKGIGPGAQVAPWSACGFRWVMEEGRMIATILSASPCKSTKEIKEK